MPKDRLAEVSGLEIKVASPRRRGDHDRDRVLGEVREQFGDAGERANCRPEEVLADRTLSGEFLCRERDIREEGEELDCCFFFDLGIVE